MASQPFHPPVTARVDNDGRLVAADGPLLALQEQAGGRLGTELAVPQLAAVARLAARLEVPIHRGVVAASEQEDLELWVRADPGSEGVTLTVEQWSARPAATRRASASAPSAELSVSADDLLTDAELRIVELSPAMTRRLGSAAEDAIGQSLARLLHPLEDDSGNLPLLSSLAARTAFHGQPALVRGTEDRLLLDGTPRLEGERFAGYAVRIRAPGEGRQVATDLPLEDLLREPLASIVEQAQDIASRSEGPLRNDYAGYGSDIAAAARHLLELISNLSPTSDTSATGEAVDLADLVLEAAGLAQPQAAAKRVELDIGGAASVPTRGRARAITQILVNIIGNAIRFSPDGATVAITLAQNGSASVTIADQGPGVAPQDRQRIFERFEQAGSKPGDAGLGLAISRRLAREMGGDVELLDTAAGAAFRLTLPLA